MLYSLLVINLLLQNLFGVNSEFCNSKQKQSQTQVLFTMQNGKRVLYFPAYIILVKKHNSPCAIIEKNRDCLKCFDFHEEWLITFAHI